MPTLKLHIKNMVCDRCIKVVGDELAAIGLKVEDIQLGYANIVFSNTAPAVDQISHVLQSAGFELLMDDDNELVEKIKVAMLAYLESSADAASPALSIFLSQYLGKNYSALSKHFSKMQGDTIEKYFIKLKMEKVKELLDYEELTLSQIAYKIGYKNVQHLSAQFKKMEGLSVTAYRRGKHHRKPLDNI